MPYNYEEIVTLVEERSAKLSLFFIDSTLEEQEFTFRLAAESGHLAVMERLLALSHDEFQRSNMIHNHDDAAFRWAAGNGHLAVMERLLALTPDEFQRSNMIHSLNDSAFRWAAANVHLAVMERLLALTPDEFQRSNMIHSLNDSAFRWVAANVHLAVMERLLALTPDEFQRSNMIHSQYDSAFRWAAGNGHLNVMFFIFTQVPHIGFLPLCALAICHGFKAIMAQGYSFSAILKIEEVAAAFSRLATSRLSLLPDRALKTLVGSLVDLKDMPNKDYEMAKKLSPSQKLCRQLVG